MEEIKARSIKLGAARVLSGMTQEEAARKLGLTKYALSRYENYKKVVPIDVAAEMARVYKVPARLIDFGCDTQALLS